MAPAMEAIETELAAPSTWAAECGQPPLEPLRSRATAPSNGNPQLAVFRTKTGQVVGARSAAGQASLKLETIATRPDRWHPPADLAGIGTVSSLEETISPWRPAQPRLSALTP